MDGGAEFIDIELKVPLLRHPEPSTLSTGDSIDYRAGVGFVTEWCRDAVVPVLVS